MTVRAGSTSSSSVWVVLWTLPRCLVRGRLSLMIRLLRGLAVWRMR